MSPLPPPTTPLNQHSLRALEEWLHTLGAEPINGDRCRWSLAKETWSAELRLDREDLVVIWQNTDAAAAPCSLPYGLSRQDVTAAIVAGP